MSKSNLYTIRKGTIEDFVLLQKLNGRLFLTEHTRGHDDALLLSWPYTPEGEEYFRKALSDPKHAVFFALCKGKPVGYVTVSAYKKHHYRTVHTGELENMFIEEGFRRKGVGKALVKAMKLWLTNEGVERVYVSAYGKNERALKFYEALGFEIWEIGLEMKL